MTQADRILKHLKRGKPITPIQALSKYGVLRRASRIHELKRDGHDIRRRTIEKQGKHFAAYWLA
jgi:hypothetical protein